MAVRENMRDLTNIEYDKLKKAEQKRQFENVIYKLINKEFNKSTDIQFTYQELLTQKNDIIYTITPKEITLYEASKSYNKILNALYKERNINNAKEEYKKAKSDLYVELESYFIKYGAAAYNILLDMNLKNDILKKYILLFPENNPELKQYYNKTIKQLYNEFSNVEEVEDVEEESKIHWEHLIIFILKILLFPVMLCIGCAATYKPNKRK